MSNFSTPFSRRYWHEAINRFRQPRYLVIAAFIAALRIVIGLLYVPLGENLRMLFKFVPDAVGALILGPVLGMITGGIADILGAFIFPTGAFFPGYTLSAILTYLIFSLFFFRSEISILRIFLARLSTNVLVNILLGSLWSEILLGKGYVYFLLKSIVKNMILLPAEAAIILIIFRALMPVISKNGMIPKQTKIHFTTFKAKNKH